MYCELLWKWRHFRQFRTLMHDNHTTMTIKEWQHLQVLQFLFIELRLVTGCHGISYNCGWNRTPVEIENDSNAWLLHSTSPHLAQPRPKLQSLVHQERVGEMVDDEKPAERSQKPRHPRYSTFTSSTCTNTLIILSLSQNNCSRHLSHPWGSTWDPWHQRDSR